MVILNVNIRKITKPILLNNNQNTRMNSQQPSNKDQTIV